MHEHDLNVRDAVLRATASSCRIFERRDRNVVATLVDIGGHRKYLAIIIIPPTPIVELYVNAVLCAYDFRFI